MAMIPWAAPKLSGTSVLLVIVAVAIALATVGLLQERHREIRSARRQFRIPIVRARAFHDAM